MKITYIGHSGFSIEIDNFTLIFDYFIDEDNIINSVLERSDNILVFASHFHPDHFSKEILSWNSIYKNITYVLGYDIPKHNIDIDFPNNVIIANVDSVIKISERIKIYSFGSTDSGCSFYVNIDDSKIFHAGDLNNWCWKEESTQDEIKKAEGDYLKILRDIKQRTNEFDVAMFPVDARMGIDYYIGAKQFVNQFKVKNFIPMHFWTFKKEACDFSLYKNNDFGKYYCLTTPGESITIK